MSLHEKVQNVKQVKQESGNKVFSMYLNTDPSDPDQQGGKWKIQFKNGMRNFRAYLEEDNDEEDLIKFKRVEKKVEKYVLEHEQDLLRGIIIFADADETLWFAQRVQMRLESEFFWEEEPRTEQLEKLKEEFPVAGAILVQQNQVKVLESYLNEVEDMHLFELNIDTENWSEKLGPRKAGGGRHPGSTNLQKDNFDKRFSANQQRWYKSIAPRLDKIAKDGSWEKVALIGEREAVNELNKQMNREVDNIVFKNMFHHNEEEVLAEAIG